MGILGHFVTFWQVLGSYVLIMAYFGSFLPFLVSYWQLAMQCENLSLSTTQMLCEINLQPMRTWNSAIYKSEISLKCPTLISRKIWSGRNFLRFTLYVFTYWGISCLFTIWRIFSTFSLCMSSFCVSLSPQTSNQASARRYGYFQLFLAIFGYFLTIFSIFRWSTRNSFYSFWNYLIVKILGSEIS